MAEEGKKENVSPRQTENSKGVWISEKPQRIICVSISVLLILAVGVFLQVQLIILRQELATLKRNFSTFEEVKSKNVRKRSSNEYEVPEGGGGTEAAHLQGAFPFQHLEKQGKIGPWSKSSTDNSFISLKKKSTEVEISQTGVYYIYAQVYYLTSESHNTFQILSYNGTEERKLHRILTSCSSQGRGTMGDVSCFTGFTGSFTAGQRLYLNQVEQNRIIHFTNGCSFLGIVLLKKNGIFKMTT